MSIQLTPIGSVVNGVHDAGDSGWGEVVSELRLRPELAPGLRGLDGFSHAVVVYYMHEAGFSPEEHLLRRPRNRADMPLLGIFSQRAKHRPNPIGVTVVRIERLEGDALFVRGLDAIDGTPILDIKPHVRMFDSPPDASEPEWIGRLLEGYF
jgi:tRNA (adenine37-N6)-methyltransferase